MSVLNLILFLWQQALLTRIMQVIYLSNSQYKTDPIRFRWFPHSSFGSLSLCWSGRASQGQSSSLKFVIQSWMQMESFFFRERNFISTIEEIFHQNIWMTWQRKEGVATYGSRMRSSCFRCQINLKELPFLRQLSQTKLLGESRWGRHPIKKVDRQVQR